MRTVTALEKYLIGTCLAVGLGAASAAHSNGSFTRHYKIDPYPTVSPDSFAAAGSAPLAAFGKSHRDWGFWPKPPHRGDDDLCRQPPSPGGGHVGLCHLHRHLHRWWASWKPNRHRW